MAKRGASKRISSKLWDELAREALAARRSAYAPYSRFKVGAALFVKDDAASDPTIISGCNIENASYGAAICAERVAIGRAVAPGYQDFGAIAIAAAGDEPVAPCGLCLQVLVEFCDDDLPILLCNLTGQRSKTRLGRLISHPFRSGQLRR